MRTFRKLQSAGFAMTALAIVHAAPALAQNASAPKPAEEDQNIVVTGTRIVRDGFQAPTPLTVLSLADIENGSPTNNIADFVNQMPALAGSTRPANSRLNLSSGQAGINALNLRNLGEVRTLVLIDGHRSVPSTITGLVDVNTIPQSLVKSVEVVTGGASAAYGSDAVAGVVNFILDKKFTGLKVTADSGVSTYGDGANYSFSVAGGTPFAGGRGHILLSGELAHTDGVFQVDRPWNATGWVRIQDPNWTATSTTPRYLIRSNVGAANSTPGGLITASTGGTANSLRGIYFGAGGSVNHYQYGALTFPSPTGSAAPSLTQGGDWQVNDSGRRIGLAPQDDRRGVFARVSYEVADGVELYAEGSYNRQRIQFNAGPNLQTGIAIRPDNAYLINQLGAAQLAGITGVTLATTAADLPYRGTDNRREVQRYAVGAEGEAQLFGKTAHWDIYGQYGRTQMREQLRNIMNLQRMLNATDAVFAPAGNAMGVAAGTIVCRSTLTDTANGCVPLNRMGLGVANPAAFNYVFGDPYRDETLQQIVTGANLSTTPFATWAGDVSVAVGGEYREEKVKGFVPTQYQPIVTQTGTSNLWSVGNYLPTNGKYNVKEAYLETVVPLGLGLEFNGAARATDYSTAGYVTTWKAGLTWQPIQDIRFRVTRSRDIRAPNLNDLYQAGSANSDSVRNPFYTGNPADGPATYSYSATVTGNRNLKPEKADQWNIGAVLTPRFVPGLNFSVDYFRIKMKDAIGTLGAQDIINRCYDGRQEYCAAYSVDPIRSTPEQPYLLFRNQPFNFASQLVRGIDIDASYRLPLNRVFANIPGSFSLRGVATRYIDNITDTGIPGTVPLNQVGVNGGQGGTPKWIYRVSGTYESETFSATIVGRGVSAGIYDAGGIVCQTGCPIATTQFPTYESNHISGLFYVDLNLAKTITVNSRAQAQFFINVTDLFNASPMLVPETGLAANSTYSDLLGRTFRVGVRFQLH